MSSRAFGLFLLLLPVVAHADLAHKENAAALIGLMADRVELFESVAKYKWNQHIALTDEKAEPAAEPNEADSFIKAQDIAALDYQQKLFAKWKKAGTDGFDAVDEIGNLRSKIDKNTQDQGKRLATIKTLLCAQTALADLNAIAAPILKERSIDQALFKPALEDLAREYGTDCHNPRPH